jgi:hypothetical protein
MKEPLDRRLNMAHRLLKGLLGLLDDPLVAVSPRTGHLTARGGVIVDLDQYGPAASQREFHEPLVHLAPVHPRGHIGSDPTHSRSEWSVCCDVTACGILDPVRPGQVVTECAVWLAESACARKHVEDPLERGHVMRGEALGQVGGATTPRWPLRESSEVDSEGAAVVSGMQRGDRYA